MQSQPSASARLVGRNARGGFEFPIGNDAKLDPGDTNARGERSWTVTIEDADHDIVKVRGIGQAPAWVDRGRTVRLTLSERTGATVVRGRILEVVHDRIRIVVAGTVSNVQRRSSQRVSIVEPVAVVCYQPGGQTQVITMRLRDLSKGGCALQAPCLIPGGTRVRVRLPMGDTAVQIPGEVVQGRPSERVGVQFGKLPADVDAALTRFLFERQPRPGLGSPPR